MSRLARTRFLSLLASALWASGLVAIFLNPETLNHIRLVLFVVFLLASLFIATRLTLGVVTIATLATGVWFYFNQNLDVVADGLQFALVFTVFLPALVLIRETLEASPEITHARKGFFALSESDRSTGLVIGNQLLGSVLTLGVIAVSAPLVKADDPEPLRRRVATDVLRGVSIAVPWSPFTIGIVYVLGFRPSLELHEVLLSGFALSVLYTVISVLQRSGVRGLGAIRSSLRVFAPLIPSVAFAVAIVLILATLTPLTTLQSVAVAMPPLCLIRLASIGRFPTQIRLANVFERIGNTGNELLLFASAVVLGFLIQRSGLAEHVVAALALDRVILPVAIGSMLLAGALLCLTGMHSILVGTVLAALLSPLDHRLPDIVEAHIILFGWMCGAMLSYGSLSIGLATRLFDVSVVKLIVGRNLDYTIWLVVVLTIVFSTWSVWLTGS